MLETCKNLLTEKEDQISLIPLRDFVCETPCDTEQCKCFHSNASIIHNQLAPLYNTGDDYKLTTITDHIISHVSCHNLKLNSPPSPLPLSTLILDLSFNNFTMLDFPDIVSTIATEELNLTNCNIQKIKIAAFWKFVDLRWLILENNHIFQIHPDTFVKLNKLERLILANNYIVDMHMDTFQYLSNLKVLCVKENLIETVTGDSRNVYLKLRQINFQHNKLLTLSANVLIMFSKSNVSVYLSGNPWGCETCENAALFEWLWANKYRVPDINEVRRQLNRQNLIYQGTSTYQCVTEDLIYHTVRDNIYIALIIILVTAVFLYIIGLVLKFLFPLHVKIFYHNMLPDIWRKQYPEMYDAFIVYESENAEISQWVVKHLLEPLENDGYKIYIEDRQFPVGVRYNEANYEAVNMCRRTIFVVSRHFMDNIPSRVGAVDQAFICMTRHKFHKIIVISYDEDYDVHLDKQIKAFISLGQHINKRGNNFWKCLVKKMPHH